MSSERDVFNSTHGKIVEGKCYTYQELEQTSPLQRIKSIFFYVILIALLLFCAVSFYVVDYKKGSHDDVINTITQLSNYSVGDIVNGTVDLTRELKEIVKHTFEANSEKGALLGGWLANQSEIINTQITSKVPTKQTVMNFILHVPVYLKDTLTHSYNYLQTVASKLLSRAPQEREHVTMKVERTSEIIEINGMEVEIEEQTIEIVTNQ